MSTSLLDLETSGEDDLYSKLLLDAAAQDPTLLNEPGSAAVPSVQVIPVPGFCVKTKNDKNEKIFINICKADNVPAPRDVTDDELIKIFEAEDPTSQNFRVPMSIGEPHAEIDKSGKGCTAFDIVINPQFYEKIQRSAVFQSFFLSCVFEGLDTKYSQVLGKDWVVLKNRKFVGSLPEQNVRTQSKPFIMEMDESPSGPFPPGSQKSPLIQEVNDSSTAEDKKLRGKDPEYRIIQEPPEGHPEYLVAEISLPQVKTANTLTLDIGEDRIVLQTRSNVYYLDIYLPYDLIQEEIGAQFNRKTRILTVTMAVRPA